KQHCYKINNSNSDSVTGQARFDVAALREETAAVAGKPMILTVHDDPKFLTFAQRKDLDVIATRGPATPDHVIRTKRIPLLGRDVQRYALDARDYLAKI